jgi:hypothetical protein
VVKIFAFLELERNCAFFKGLLLGIHSWGIENSKFEASNFGSSQKSVGNNLCSKEKGYEVFYE